MRLGEAQPLLSLEIDSATGLLLAEGFVPVTAHAWAESALSGQRAA